MNIDIDKVTKVILGKLNEYSDGRFYRELEIITENGKVTVTISGEEEGLIIKL